MTYRKQSQTPDEKAGSRFVWLTKYESDAGSDPEGNNTTDTMKNFPKAFIPMKELDELLFGE